MDSSQAATPASPPKGQGNDSSRKTWRSSWWDFYPLFERPRRPLVWSQSSVIWTAHPTQALIIGRHFSSSKQFVLSSPTPVISSPGSFEPPTVIAVSPTDNWLFAFYPRKDGEGVGCIWKRGAQIDNWQVKESWAFPKCGGAVTASWLGNPREWVFTSMGTSRLPYRGPATPVSNPTLAVVTEDCGLCIFYYRYIVSGLRSIKRSLIIAGITPESTNQLTATDDLENSNRPKHCMDATISVGYSETSIMVATHSRKVPSPSSTSDPIDVAHFNSIDNMVPQTFDDYELWGEEHTVEIHEVQLKFDGVIMSILCHTFGTVDIGNVSLANMAFLCAPPPLQSAADRSTHKIIERGRTFLALSTVDLRNYTSPPTSNLALYSILQKSTRGPLSMLTLNHDSSRNIREGVITYIDSFVEISATYSILMQTYVVHHSGSLAERDGKAKDLPTGKIMVLNIPDLTDTTHFEESTVDYPWDSIGRDLPIFASTSPNRRLLCTLSSSHWKTRITVHTLPKRKTLELYSASHLASQLVIATLQRRSTADIIHDMVSPKMSLSETANILFHSLRMLKSLKPSLPYASTWDMIGVAVEIYREKARLCKDEEEREVLENRWQMAHDICSIAACNIAFEDCKEGEAYDLEAAWQLIGLCAWVVKFTETLLKAAVLCNSSEIEKLLLGAQETSPLFAPHLLHFVHPFTLQNLIVALKHVVAIRTYIGSLPAGGENPQMAKLILTDTVDGSGVNFNTLICSLEKILPIANTLDPKLCQRALANCQPLAGMRPILVKVLNVIYDSEEILNKTALFIKPFDLVDGIARLSMDSGKTDGNDVLTKSILPKEGSKNECLRCGGRAVGSKNIGKIAGTPAARWVLWERMWQLRCVCGGPWLTVTVH